MPAPRKVRTERDERIRRAYFLEGKGIKQIAKGFHHSKRIVRRVVYDRLAAGADHAHCQPSFGIINI